MKILFITDNYIPESNAPALRTSEHCKIWADQNEEITVLTCFPNFPKGIIYPGYKNKLYSIEYIDNIRIVRVWSYMAANEGSIKRIIDYISFGLMSFLASLFIKTDTIIATSPQFFTAIFGLFSSILKRKKFILEIRDLWPESIVAVGAIKNKFIIHILEKIEKHLYKKADKIIVVTESFVHTIAAHGVNKNKIKFIPNGVNLSEYLYIPKNNQIIETLGLHNKTIIAYIGTHGMAHALDFILHSIKEIKDQKLHFLFIGDGSEKNKLITLAKELQLNNVTFLNAVPKSELKNISSIIDISLVNLMKSPTFQSVIPSKIFENAAMQKPILLGVDGEAKFIIEKYRAGLCYEPENKNDFISKLYQLLEPSNYSLAQHGCLNLAMNYNRNTLAMEMLSCIKS